MGHTQGNTAGGAGTWTIVKPTECVTNGWLIALTSSNVLDATHSLAPVDTNWTQIGHLQAGSTGAAAAHMHVFRKRVLASEAGTNGPANYQFTVTGGARTASFVMIAYSDLDQSDPVVERVFSNSGNVSDTSIFCPGLTGGVDGQPLIRAAAHRSTFGFNALGTYTQRINYSPAEVDFAINWQEKLVAGAVGGQTITAVNAGQHVGLTMVFLPGAMSQTSRLLPDGVVAQIGYANATTGNITNLHGDPDVSGGTGFTAS